MTVTILRGDCRDVLRTLPAESVHSVVTSPPYFGLRDYGMAGQIGLETSPDEFVDELVAVFREVRRILRSDGTLWLNLGDSYASAWPCNRRNVVGSGSLPNGKREARPPRMGRDLKEKDLIGVPWMVAFALRADGWYLRQDIIWSKPNPMPESVRDRCTKAHEYVFLLSKSERYFYDADAIAEESVYKAGEGGHQRFGKPGGKAAIEYGKQVSGEIWQSEGTRNKRSVWEITTAPFPEAHFATFPPALIEPCILAGCPQTICAECGSPWVRRVERESVAMRPNSNSIRGKCPSSVVSGSPQRGAVGARVTTLGFEPSCSCNAGRKAGTVLDPFGGAGTTGLVADRLGRNGLLIELNPKYATMAERRIKTDAGMFASVSTSP